MTDTAAKPASSLPKAGRSADAAIRHAAESADDEVTGRTYVAVPERSWRPVTVTVETKTTIRLD